MPTPPQPALNISKILEACLALAQNISQWDLLIIAGSIVIIIGTSYYRPTLSVRAAYFLFVPAWILIALSIYRGILVQRSYVAYLFGSRSKAPPASLDQIPEAIANDIRSEIDFLQAALMILALWLVIYLVWWIFSKQAGVKP